VADPEDIVMKLSHYQLLISNRLSVELVSELGYLCRTVYFSDKAAGWTTEESRLDSKQGRRVLLAVVSRPAAATA
jgi:hypothetical protein